MKVGPNGVEIFENGSKIPNNFLEKAWLLSKNFLLVMKVQYVWTGSKNKPAAIYLFNVTFSGVFIVNLEQISQIVLEFPFLTWHK